MRKDLILLVSRNVDNQRRLKKIITQADYDFINANSLPIASSVKFRMDYGKPDLIILDLDKTPSISDMWDLKHLNNVPVISFVDGKRYNFSEKYTASSLNNSSSQSKLSKMKILLKQVLEEVLITTEEILLLITRVVLQIDVLVERPVSSAKLLMLIAEYLNKNTTSIIK